MAWRAPTQDDLNARLSSDEIEAFSLSADGAADPVSALLEQSADEARGYITANRNAVISRTPHALPEMLIGPVMDLAVYNLLKRQDVVPNDARKEAWQKAVELLRDIASGKITPEPGETSETVLSVAAPSIGVRPPIL